ncbi:hypothetical protein BCR33DRAFT_738269 [Rhizoclosmatium globosum]|uniref:Uncharacterized protein n=1 Tax=Rhizoclosmatium globosum TaxID=329046 RepID=A0A1Y2CAP3_9FUNG|nr:hypothetical protein BCR33DRAFT_738269 [Rhizoclosmatium globosum]|eukprot:ORY44101.1 hypothetical protein BCR33DRAFT_738269 [Rhizoclosmatium globosum]
MGKSVMERFKDKDFKGPRGTDFVEFVRKKCGELGFDTNSKKLGYMTGKFSPAVNAKYELWVKVFVEENDVEPTFNEVKKWIITEFADQDVIVTQETLTAFAYRQQRKPQPSGQYLAEFERLLAMMDEVSVPLDNEKINTFLKAFDEIKRKHILHQILGAGGKIKYDWEKFRRVINEMDIVDRKASSLSKGTGNEYFDSDDSELEEAAVSSSDSEPEITKKHKHTKTAAKSSKPDNLSKSEKTDSQKTQTKELSKETKPKQDPKKPASASTPTPVSTPDVNEVAELMEKMKLFFSGTLEKPIPPKKPFLCKYCDKVTGTTEHPGKVFQLNKCEQLNHDKDVNNWPIAVKRNENDQMAVYYKDAEMKQTYFGKGGQRQLILDTRARELKPVATTTNMFHVHKTSVYGYASDDESIVEETVWEDKYEYFKQEELKAIMYSLKIHPVFRFAYCVPYIGSPYSTNTLRFNFNGCLMRAVAFFPELDPPVTDREIIETLESLYRRVKYDNYTVPEVASELIRIRQLKPAESRMFTINVVDQPWDERTTSSGLLNDKWDDEIHVNAIKINPAYSSLIYEPVVFEGYDDKFLFLDDSGEELASIVDVFTEMCGEEVTQFEIDETYNSMINRGVGNGGPYTCDKIAQEYQEIQAWIKRRAEDNAEGDSDRMKLRSRPTEIVQEKPSVAKAGGPSKPTSTVVPQLVKKLFDPTTKPAQPNTSGSSQPSKEASKPETQPTTKPEIHRRPYKLVKKQLTSKTDQQVIDDILKSINVTIPFLELMQLSSTFSRGCGNLTTMERQYLDEQTSKASQPTTTPIPAQLNQILTLELERDLTRQYFMNPTRVEDIPTSMCNIFVANYKTMVSPQEYADLLKAMDRMESRKPVIKSEDNTYMSYSYSSLNTNANEFKRRLDPETQYSTYPSIGLKNVLFQGIVTLYEVPLDSCSDSNFVQWEIASLCASVNELISDVHLIMVAANNGKTVIAAVVQNSTWEVASFKYKQKSWVLPALPEGVKPSFYALAGMPFWFAANVNVKFDDDGNCWANLKSPDRKKNVNVQVANIHDPRVRIDVNRRRPGKEDDDSADFQ